jgi:hypothetical protein
MGTAEMGFVRGPGLRLGLRGVFVLLLEGSEFDAREKENKNCFGTAAVTALRLFIVVCDAVCRGSNVLAMQNPWAVGCGAVLTLTLVT